MLTAPQKCRSVSPWRVSAAWFCDDDLAARSALGGDGQHGPIAVYMVGVTSRQPPVRTVPMGPSA